MVHTQRWLELFIAECSVALPRAGGMLDVLDAADAGPGDAGVKATRPGEVERQYDSPGNSWNTALVERPFDANRYAAGGTPGVGTGAGGVGRKGMLSNGGERCVGRFLHAETSTLIDCG